MSDKTTNDNPGGLAGVIRQGILNYIKDLHTVLPGRIVSFDPSKQTATVQPQIQRLFKIGEDEVPVSIPSIINAVVWFPRAGGFALTLPVLPGDDCLILIAERSIDNWFTFGLEQAPNEKRLHNLSDSIVLVGMAPQPRVIDSYDASNAQLRNEANNQHLTLKNSGDILIEANGTTITMGSGGDIEVVSPSLVSVEAPEVTLDTPKVTCTGNLQVDGNITFAGTSIGSGTSTAADHISGGISGKTHVHGGVIVGGADTEEPQ